MKYMDEFYFESAAMILTLITVGKMLEEFAVGFSLSERIIPDISHIYDIQVKEGCGNGLVVEMEISPRCFFKLKEHRRSKWAEVLSADAFSLFQEKGIFNPVVGNKWLDEVLSRGGSRPAMESFVAFRGRKPSVDALLRQYGLVESK